ncbi:uncharacterized protein FMAN_13202 [Fusarium mangiferae]|uniref:DUF7791 domain-containing protein n=1 Tax=Fusarium mangiferae TaxID=192010 RepID=A0A1L7T854_FUSMA|nr:uncharacterized protein FMAN_13202 [Fusarium mangiferae]CVK94918.1 uncharacterized protein FMAN_13202 [Fusarium mangiferae]
MRWLQTTNTVGILLEDLTRFDMHTFLRKRFRELLFNGQVSLEFYDRLRQQLVDKAQGVFLWLHLATRSIIEGIQNNDSENMLSIRLHELPRDLEKLYIDMWQRSNAESNVYQETARKFFHYAMGYSEGYVLTDPSWDIASFLPLTLQIACADDPAIQKTLFTGTGTIGMTEMMRMCDDLKASIHTRCAGMLEVQTQELDKNTSEMLGCKKTAVTKALGRVSFIHRTAHDFLTDTEAGHSILGREPLSAFSYQTQLLKGLICVLIGLTSEWDLPWDSYTIIECIANFATRWGIEGFQVATQMLDVIQPLFDKHFARNSSHSWRNPPLFLTALITHHEIFDDYVISCLANDTSPDLATNIMREGWCSEPRPKLCKRIFAKLMDLGADPHRYGILLSCFVPEPFVRKKTAFTNLLTYHFSLLQHNSIYEEVAVARPRLEEFHLELPYETLEMAIQMAKTCQDPNAAVAFFASFADNGTMRLLATEVVTWELSQLNHKSLFVVYEINIQFLLLYLLSKIGDNVPESVSKHPEAQDVVSKFDSPSIKVRYFMRPRLTEDGPKKDIAPRRKFERVISRAASLSSIEIKRLFDMKYSDQCRESCKTNEAQRHSDVITQFINDLETEEVDVEDMMVTLASENLGLGTYEEAGMIPSLKFLRGSEEMTRLAWTLFPLSMRRLEVAAAAKEAMKGQV